MIHYHFKGCKINFNPGFSIPLENDYAIWKLDIVHDKQCIYKNLMIKTELCKLIKSSLKITTNINEKNLSHNIEEWDSLGQLSILTALDKKTKGKTSKFKSLTDATSLSAIIKISKTKKIIKD